MSETQSVAVATPSAVHAKLNKSPGAIGMIIFAIVLIGGFAYAGFNLASDLSGGGHFETIWPYVLLGVALLTALGFEFVNGFHDTANAVATVIYTHSMEPHIAVVWSGMWNLIGVLTSSGAVAFTIISLLPVELILQVGHGAGFAMVFALLDCGHPLEPGHLVAWPAGLQLAHPDRFDHRRRSRQPVDEPQGLGHERRRLGSGRRASSGRCSSRRSSVLCWPEALLFLLKKLIKVPELYKAPEGDAPPPFWIRGLLILTCTRRQLRPRLQRRPKGHGTHHAHPDRHRAYGLRAESRCRAGSGAGLRGSLPAGCERLRRP